jgi:hypothetical protein
MSSRVVHHTRKDLLTVAIPGLTQRPAQRVLDGRNAGNAHGACLIGDGRQDDGAEAGRLDFALCQPNNATIMPAPSRPRRLISR